jgi:hypothetical protein
MGNIMKRVKLGRIGTVAAVGAISFSFGCSTFVDSVINKTASSAGDKVGQSVGNRMGDQMVANMSPMMTQYWVGALFAYAFNAGPGQVAVSEVAYKKGQFTTWNLPSNDDAQVVNTVQRAYLGDDADGNQWWKVKFVDNKNNQTTVLEALFNKDRSKMLRLRSRFPQDKEAKEMPVTENTYYVAPTALTKESVKGATKGTETVTVPAGTFKAKHVVFGDAAGGTSEWYLNDSVPGGNVQMVHAYPQSENSADAEKKPLDTRQYKMQLAAYGNDATSELGSLDAAAATNTAP